MFKPVFFFWLVTILSGNEHIHSACIMLTNNFVLIKILIFVKQYRTVRNMWKHEQLRCMEYLSTLLISANLSLQITDRSFRFKWKHYKLLIILL